MYKKVVFCAMALLLCFSIGTVQAQELTIDEMSFGTGVEDRAIQGSATEFSSDVGRVYCFNKISGATDETSVTHVWYLNDEEKTRTSLTLRGTPWRTWSYKTITENMTGNWKVEVVSSSGAVLKSMAFTVK